MQDKKSTKINIADDGTVRQSLINDNYCYVEMAEIDAFRAMVSSGSPVKFNRNSFGDRISSRPETLRLLFFPFMDGQPFMKYSSVSRVSVSLVSSDGNNFSEFTIDLREPVYYLETSDSDIVFRKIIKSIKKLILSVYPDAESRYDMSGKPHFEMEVSKFSQIFVRRDLSLDVDDISIFFKKKRVGMFGDNGVLSAASRITDTRENRDMILRIVKQEGIFQEIFHTRVQFSEQEIRESIVPKMRWGKFFERESAKTAVNLLIGQKAISQQIFIDVMSRMKGNKEFSKMIKTSKKLKARFKNDHAILLLMAMS